MEAKSLTFLGLVLDFIGAVALLAYGAKTLGGTTTADHDYLASPW
jgi:hypothetical protein